MDPSRDEISPNEDQDKIRRSNRRTLLGFGLVILVFAGPAAYRIGRALIELL